jgi:hypothetical protein
MYWADRRRTLAPLLGRLFLRWDEAVINMAFFDVSGGMARRAWPGRGGLQGLPLQPVTVLCDARGMTAAIRQYKLPDENVVVELALRAWAPVWPIRCCR